MRRIIFFIATAMLLSFSGRAQSLNSWAQFDTMQFDTLQCYPYLYLYNWPDTTLYHDETSCTYSSGCFGAVAGGGAYAFYQHTDVPLNVVGIAFMTLSHDYMTLRVYDSAMNNVLVSDTTWVPTCFYSGYSIWNYPDSLDTTRYKIFVLPGKTHVGPNDPLFEKILLRFKYFTSGKPITVNGDFWIELSQPFIAWESDAHSIYLKEEHEAPYRINNVRYKHFDDNTGVWGEETTLLDGYIPELFLIVAPECTDVEGVTVTETDGCVDVAWDSVEGQTQWQVFLQGPGVSQTDTVDVCHWHYCGYDTNAYYNVYVSSLCEGPQGWSEWSDAVHFGNPQPQTIATTAGAQFMLSPNPAAGQVTVTAEEGLRHIEVYDVRGALVYSAAADGTTAVVETKAWPTGQYVVTVETRAGKGSRVLTVSR